MDVNSTVFPVEVWDLIASKMTTEIVSLFYLSHKVANNLVVNRQIHISKLLGKLENGRYKDRCTMFIVDACYRFTVQRDGGSWTTNYSDTLYLLHTATMLDRLDIVKEVMLHTFGTIFSYQY
jgi:hypothetical protein